MAGVRECGGTKGPGCQKAGLLERSTRLELALRAWKALVLPLHHDRLLRLYIRFRHCREGGATLQALG